MVMKMGAVMQFMIYQHMAHPLKGMVTTAVVGIALGQLGQASIMLESTQQPGVLELQGGERTLLALLPRGGSGMHVWLCSHGLLNALGLESDKSGELLASLLARFGMCCWGSLWRVC